MSFPLSDPLEGIATRPAEVQVALIVAAIQDIRGKVVELKTELAATKRALYTVALSVTGSALLFAITIAFTFRK